MEARQTTIKLTYNGKDISEDISRFITEFRYNDVSQADAIDDISLTLEDVAGLWKSGWMPEIGAKFTAVIECQNWFTNGDHLSRSCGSFEIDDFTAMGGANDPSEVKVSAVAVGISNSIRRQENSRNWESITIKAITEDIAARHGFELKWYSSYNPIMDRWEQKQESDLAFLRRTCEFAGLMLKITDSKLVVWRGEEFDEKRPELVIKRGQEGLNNYRFNVNTADVFSAAEVQYWDPIKHEMLTFLYRPDGLSGIRGTGGTTTTTVGGGHTIDERTRMVTRLEAQRVTTAEPEIVNPPIGQVLRINRRVSSLAEAEQVARAALRTKNMRMVRGNLTFMGNIKLYSGLNIAVAGFGRFDTVTFQVEEVNHSYNRHAGLKTHASIRGVISY